MGFSCGLLCAFVVCSLLSATGCGTSSRAASNPIDGIAFMGRVKGGERPVSGATIQLYAASGDGDASPATPLLKTKVLTDAEGQFSITGDYVCPSSSTLVYVTATGGNPSSALGFRNPSLALMSALGQCGALNSSTPITLNEVTTVASVWPLANFAASYARVGAGAADQMELKNAFNEVAELVNIGIGSMPGPLLPPGFSSPAAKINTLADVITACVNSSGGNAGDGSPCGDLFQAVTPVGGLAPTDTVGAALSIAQSPAQDVAEVYSLLQPNPPFQPALTTPPTDWSIAVELGSPLAMPDRADLLGEYLLQQGSGSVATDTSGLSNDGSISGATWEGIADLNFTQGNFIQVPEMLNAANTWQFAVYSPPFGFFRGSLPPEVGDRGAFGINPSFLCGTDSAHTCLIASFYPGVVSQQFYAINSSLTEAANPLTAGWHVVTLVGGQNGMPDHYFYDGQEVSYLHQGSGLFLHPATGNYQIGGSNQYTSSWFTGKLAAAWAWRTSLDAAQVQAAAASALTFIRSKGAAPTYGTNPHTTPVVLGGIDSRTAGAYQYQGGDWIYQLAMTNPSYSTLDMGISGATLFDQAAMFDQFSGPQIVANTADTIEIFWGGVNDFTAYPDMPISVMASSMQTLVKKAKADGARVIVATEISSSLGDDLKQELDTILRAQAYSWGADNVADLATVPQLGADGAFQSTLYFADGVHPTAFAEPLITNVMSNAVNELIGSTASQHHIIQASKYTEQAGDRFLDLAGNGPQVVTLPDCIGYSLARQVTNLGSSPALLNTQSGEILMGSVAVPPGTTAVLTPLPGNFSTGGCSWQRN